LTRLRQREGECSAERVEPFAEPHGLSKASNRFRVFAGERVCEREKCVAGPERRIELHGALAGHDAFLVPTGKSERVAQLGIDDR
jgi:hypothetical protein